VDTTVPAVVDPSDCSSSPCTNERGETPESEQREIHGDAGDHSDEVLETRSSSCEVGADAADDAAEVWEPLQAMRTSSKDRHVSLVSGDICKLLDFPEEQKEGIADDLEACAAWWGRPDTAALLSSAAEDMETATPHLGHGRTTDVFPETLGDVFPDASHPRWLAQQPSTSHTKTWNLLVDPLAEQVAINISGVDPPQRPTNIEFMLRGKGDYSIPSSHPAEDVTANDAAGDQEEEDEEEGSWHGAIFWQFNALLFDVPCLLAFLVVLVTIYRLRLLRTLLRNGPKSYFAGWNRRQSISDVQTAQSIVFNQGFSVIVDMVYLFFAVVAVLLCHGQSLLRKISKSRDIARQGGLRRQKACFMSEDPIRTRYDVIGFDREEPPMPAELPADELRLQGFREAVVSTWNSMYAEVCACITRTRTTDIDSGNSVFAGEFGDWSLEEVD